MVSKELARWGPTGALVSVYTAPGDNQYEAVFRSWYWLVIVRILLATYAFYTAMVAFFELRFPPGRVAPARGVVPRRKVDGMHSASYLVQFPVVNQLEHICLPFIHVSRSLFFLKPSSAFQALSGLVNRQYFFSSQFILLWGMEDLKY